MQPNIIFVLAATSSGYFCRSSQFPFPNAFWIFPLGCLRAPQINKSEMAAWLVMSSHWLPHVFLVLVEGVTQAVSWASHLRDFPKASDSSFPAHLTLRIPQILCVLRPKHLLVSIASSDLPLIST